MVFDLTNEKSFANLDNWKREFINQGGVREADTFPFIVMGNKCDKVDDRIIDKQVAEDYCSDNGHMPFFETSAKDDEKVSDAFLEAVKLAATQHKEEDIYVQPAMVIRPQMQKRQTQDSCQC